MSFGTIGFGSFGLERVSEIFGSVGDWGGVWGGVVSGYSVSRMLSGF